MRFNQLFCVLAFSTSAFAGEPVLDLIYQKEGDAVSVINHGSAAIVPKLGNKDIVSVEAAEHFNALRFVDHSNQYIEIKGQTIDYDKGFTVALWIRPDFKKKWMELFSLGIDSKPSGVRLRWSPMNSTGAVLFLSGNETEAQNLRAPADSVPANTWSHVASVYDGNELVLFVNGEIAASRSKGDIVFTPPKSLPLVIGNYSGRKDAYPYVGLMGPVKLYPVPLTQEEIRKLAKQ